MKKTSSITYMQLLVIVTSILSGFVIATFYFKVASTEQTTLSAYDLIGFVLSVFLAGASIVLAITAINLGKSSEQVLIQRNDESIRLQNEVFAKTTDALQRIESSTGVTEKRIEDIIAGRVTDISHQAAELTTRTSTGIHLNANQLEENIRQSLLSSFTSDSDSKSDRDYRLAELREKRRLQAEQEALYQKAHNSFLLDIGNQKNVSIVKLGHGTPNEVGEKLFDGIFKIGSKMIGCSTFRQNPADNDNSHLATYLNNAASELSKGLVDEVRIGFFKVDDKENDERENFTHRIIKNFNADISKKFSIEFFGPDTASD